MLNILANAFHCILFKVLDPSVIKYSTTEYQRTVKYYDYLKSDSVILPVDTFYWWTLTLYAQTEVWKIREWYWFLQK